MHKNLYSLILLALCLLSSCFFKTTEKKMIIIQGKLQYKNSYCLGVAPTQEQEMELKKLLPLEGFRLIVKKGTYNDVKEDIFLATKTDELGKYEFNLPKGNYVLLTDYHINDDAITKDIYLEISDKSAYKTWLDEGLKQFSESCEFNQVWIKKCNVPVGLKYVRFNGPLAP